MIAHASLCRHGWFWVIPLPDGITSVGVVGTQAFFKTRTEDLGPRSSRGRFRATPSLAARMTRARAIGPLVSAANFSLPFDASHGRRLHSDRPMRPPSSTRSFPAASCWP